MFNYLELMCSGRVGSSCSTCYSRRVNLVTNPVINHEWGKDREVLTTSGTYPWSFVTQIFHNGRMSFFDIRILITSLVSSNPSYSYIPQTFISTVHLFLTLIIEYVWFQNNISPNFRSQHIISRCMLQNLKRNG
jgi:hypothetical protein